MSYVANLYPGKKRHSAQSTNADHIAQRRRDLDSVTTNGFMADESIEQAAAEQARLAAVKAVEDELARNLTELHKEDRARVLNLKDDQSVFEDPNQPQMLSSQAEADEYNRAEVRKFLAETPAYYADNEGKNLQTISQYLERNGRHVIVSARVLKQVFERLSSLGLLIQRPEPVTMTMTAPTHVAPAAPAVPVQTVWDIKDVYTGNSVHDLFEGFDPNGSGQRVRLKESQIAKLSMDEFKTFSRVTVANKPDYARVEDRDPSFLASQFVNLGQGR